MSINEAYILVNTGDGEAVADQTAAFLRRWKKEVAPRISPSFDDSADWGLDENWRREYLLWPSEGGWSVLIDGARQNSQPDCAQHLARELKTSAVWCLLLGGCYLWRHRIFDHGREVKAEMRPGRSPALKWLFPLADGRMPPPASPPREGEKIPMPLCNDAEEEAYAFLGALGVPPRLRLVQYDTRIPPQVAREADLDYSGWHIQLDGLAERVLKTQVVKQPLVKPSPLPEMPVRFDGVAKDKRGRRYLIERRRLWGEPGPEALERLLELELEVRNRHEYPFLALPDAAAPVLRFQYLHETLDKGELEKRLEVRRRPFERLHPTQRQFLRLAKRVLAKRWPQYRTGEAIQFGFHVLPAEAPPGHLPAPIPQGRSWVIRLDNAYREYRRHPGTLSPAAYLSRFFERVFSALQEAWPRKWPEVREHILPRLWGGEELSEPGAERGGPSGPRPMRAVARGLWAGLVYECAGGLFQINGAALARWGVDFDTAFSAALEVLERRTRGEWPEASWDESRTDEGGRVLSVRHPRGNASARALLRSFREALLRRLDDEAAIVSFPDRDTICAVANSDPFGIEALRKTAKRAFRSREIGLSPELFRLAPERLSRYESWPK